MLKISPKKCKVSCIKREHLLKFLLEAEHVDVKDLVAHFAINQVLVMLLKINIYV